eukprot:TRINITY_DN5809_c0_g2_i1.p1 TRINITY_DN5809_c0_g2~~TRINITY_DN5809_c0_g2_i1.p1  ORF type:complete len:178 (-),score=1.15 TRINITY_DN5809_c0_g2_i1:1447-1980(-)
MARLTQRRGGSLIMAGEENAFPPQWTTKASIYCSYRPKQSSYSNKHTNITNIYAYTKRMYVWYSSFKPNGIQMSMEWEADRFVLFEGMEGKNTSNFIEIQKNENRAQPRNWKVNGAKNKTNIDSVIALLLLWVSKIRGGEIKNNEMRTVLFFFFPLYRFFTDSNHQKPFCYYDVVSE